MTILVSNCPHCGAERMSMNYVAAIQPAHQVGIAAFSCNGCHELNCVRFFHSDSSVQWVQAASGEFEETGKHRFGLHILARYPTPKTSAAPGGLSPAVARAYLQGVDNARRGHSDAAASMFRKAIDVATRELDPSFAGKNLAPRIDLLAEKGRLTADLKEWAHLIRLDGNQGAHDDEELTTAEIDQLHAFTELFLTYTFTLPAQVKARKDAALQG
ncbi:DUF4145 domain-containing protein [Xanthomonas translucens pv. undulosa]|uniref:DUF4145 domain-containing protein n=1 Tax=Xanthomonas campestris pv. translucens TaxID=343 RepID=UPI0009BCB12D|nr:DUF4145 domain-containing protein [Xanthomonas translucens]QSQ41313.1 DUF4145 domain-containing protein [Xanthomonas translucens pv. translucens]QSQ47490.1 DUF4145 domain-containing protein [Xanthomonas translucens pv. undulosa]UJB15975.1 DUF4145 domain-containing protein [Xanthomonas translucens pv. undulosa]UPU48714.1 DUF4145 domain-containing protein [Xanthomonas translucens pv. undulosa]WLA01852.1 DUF4145 domain-containing protein [Xanthomonas translucens]